MSGSSTDHGTRRANHNGGSLPDIHSILRSMVAESEAAQPANGGTTSDILANWLVVQYVTASRRIAQKAGDAGIDLPTLSTLTTDIVALRRGDHYATRLLLERERLEIERNKTEERIQAQFEEWLKDPKNAKRLIQSDLPLEEREKRMRELFSLGPPREPGLSPSTLAEIENAAKIL